MTKTSFSISPDILSNYPAITVAAARVKFTDIERLNSIILELSIHVKKLTEELAVIDPITSLSEIACWREAYGKMGVKPSKYHSSIEALLRRVKKGQDITTGLPIVDFYNLISIIQRSPIGAYDGQKVGAEEITMRYANPNVDTFLPLGSSADAFPLNPSLVIYGTKEEVLCWGFNSRDSKRVCVDEQSNEVLFFSESTSENFQHKPKDTINKIIDLLAFGGAEAEPIVICSADQPVIQV